MYRVTEVLEWWLQAMHDPPEWFPVTGRLHEDEAFFNLHEHHYHVDARFLSPKHETAAKLKNLRMSAPLARKWHRSAQEIIARFPIRNDHSWHFVIRNGVTRLRANVEMRIEPGNGLLLCRRPRRRKRLTRSEA